MGLTGPGHTVLKVDIGFRHSRRLCPCCTSWPSAKVLALSPVSLWLGACPWRALFTLLSGLGSWSWTPSAEVAWCPSPDGMLFLPSVGAQAARCSSAAQRSWTLPGVRAPSRGSPQGLGLPHGVPRSPVTGTGLGLGPRSAAGTTQVGLFQRHSRGQCSTPAGPSLPPHSWLLGNSRPQGRRQLFGSTFPLDRPDGARGWAILTPTLLL